MYPQREQQWCLICYGGHSSSECPTFRAKFNGICNFCGKYGHESRYCLTCQHMQANRAPLALPTPPQVQAIMAAPTNVQTMQQIVRRNQIIAHTTPSPPPMLGS